MARYLVMITRYYYFQSGVGAGMNSSAEGGMSVDGPQETVRFKNERALLWVLDIGIAICVWQLFYAFKVIPHILAGFIMKSLLERAYVIFNISAEVAAINAVTVVVGAATFIWWAVWQRAVVSYRYRFLGLLWSGTFAFVALLVHQLFNALGVYTRAGSVYDYIVVAMQFIMFWSCAALLPLLCQWRRHYKLDYKQLIISCFRIFCVAVLYDICIVNAGFSPSITILPFVRYSIVIVLIFMGAKSLHDFYIYSADKSIIHNSSAKNNRPDIGVWLCLWCMAGSILSISYSGDIYFFEAMASKKFFAFLSILSLAMVILSFILAWKLILNNSVEMVVNKFTKIAVLAIFCVFAIDVFQCYMCDDLYIYIYKGEYTEIYIFSIAIKNGMLCILLGGTIAVLMGTLSDMRYRSLENNEVVPLTVAMIILGAIQYYIHFLHGISYGYSLDYTDPYYKLLFIAAACGLVYRMRVLRHRRGADVASG